jgi:hypothetical protein
VQATFLTTLLSVGWRRRNGGEFYREPKGWMFVITRFQSTGRPSTRSSESLYAVTMIMPIFLSDFSGHDTHRSQEIPHTVTGRVHDQGVDLVGGYQERVSRGEQHQRPRQLPVGDGPQHAESLLGGLGIRNLYVAVLIRVDA